MCWLSHSLQCVHLLGINAELTYQILDSNVTTINDLLTINQSTGVISKIISANFDRETTGDISLTVIAYDSGLPPLNGTAQVIIRLQVSLILH